MIHKGNISQITITAQDIVDVVIGGSPCQDLSVAGKRAGLKHEANGDNETTRSGLFMEQIRIMKEMRELDKASGRTGIDVRCRWGVWENVPGALSSNQGEDFRIVLEEFCKIADPNASVPRPSNGKWNNSGCIVGDEYSVAWRIMDARYNGVPQRRRRITLVADFAGQSAPPILFDEEGMRWDFETSQEAWKRAAGHAERCPAGSGREGLGDGTARQVYLKFDPETSMLWNNIRRLEMRLSDSETEEGREEECENLRCRLSEMYDELNGKIRSIIRIQHEGNPFEVRCLNPWDSESKRVCAIDGVFPTLYAAECGGGQLRAVVYSIDADSSNSMKSKNPNSGFHKTDHAKCLDTSGGNPVCNQGGNVVCQEICAFTQNQREEVRELGETAGAVSSQSGTHQQTYVVAAFMGGQGEKAGGLGYQEEESPTLKSTPSGGNTVPDVVYAIDQQGGKGNANYAKDEMPTLLSDSHGTPHGVCYSIEGNTVDRNSNKNGKGYGENESPTLNTQDRHAVAYDTTQITSPQNSSNPTVDGPCHGLAANQHKPLVVIFDARGNRDGATSCTITGDHCNRVTDYTPIVASETVGSLCARDYKGVGKQFVDEDKVVVDRAGFFDKQRIGQYGNGQTSSTLSARDYKDASDLICERKNRKYIVRRLTTLECSRLQGLKDDWCVVPPQESVTDEDVAFWKPFWDEWMQINGKKPKTESQIAKWLMSDVSESAQYQMYGNGIAAPQWFWVCGRIIETYGEKKPTMASLFDGTGSFPWIWNSILGGDYTVWSSEVNPEAIRVSKYRIG